MRSVSIAREPVSAIFWRTTESVEGVINSIHPRGLLQPRYGKAPDPNGIPSSRMPLLEKVFLAIGILMFVALILFFIYMLMSTGREMNDLLRGTYGSSKKNPEKSSSESIISAPSPAILRDQKSDKARPVSNLSPAPSVKDSVSESDQYWLWWSRKENKIEDEEARLGPRDSPRRSWSNRDSGENAAGAAGNSRVARY